VIARIRIAWVTADRNERNFWLGLLMLFVGLTWFASVFVALTVIGAVLVIESVITSYWQVKTRRISQYAAH
jgi:hypothetical protein